MTKLKSEFLNILESRGFYYQCTDLAGLDLAFQTVKPLPAYIGFDVTADCLHIGSLVQIMMLYWLQQTGGKPIVVLGGGTTKVGDPSGKDASRKLLNQTTIDHNKQSIEQLLSQFIQFGNDANDAMMIDNAQWLDELNYIDVLRDVGPLITINRMLTFDSVKSRLTREQPLTFLEFNYMILQAYDFYELNKRYNCHLQLGGADQWGNIVSGIDLTRKKSQKTVYGYTVPLITTSAGQKMGKTANGAIWLKEPQTSSYDFWQFWRNTPDNDVIRFLKLFTTIPLDEIERLAQLQGQDINVAKILLANSVTAFCHGQSAAADAEKTANQTFSEGGMGQNLPSETILADIALTDVLIKLNFSTSKSSARRLIIGGGVRIESVKIQDENHIIKHTPGSNYRLSVGKKRHAIIKSQ
ncbi:MAG: tyrosine--tRNA ligase [Legionellales bacterium]|nr:tyrosine--tRNA ligase [Legionellales bacterium]|tara:strand:+ start:814 stop:2046 length:1233 start_codon:yes stop_codon:yes gene_type:complete